jgi:hypothetical protein
VGLSGAPEAVEENDNGFKSVLEEQGSKCKPICLIENQDGCMSRLLSNQDDVRNQVSMLQELIITKGHRVIC